MGTDSLKDVFLRLSGHTVLAPYLQELIIRDVLKAVQHHTTRRLTLSRWDVKSWLLNNGETAKGRRSQISAFSWRFVAGRSPTGVFLPITHFAHFLPKGKRCTQLDELLRLTLRLYRTVSSDEP